MAKKLLNEAVVRRFQSLANIKPINEMRSSIEEEQVEETIDEGVYEAEEEAPEAMDLPPEAPPEGDDLESELGDEAAAVDDVEISDEVARNLIDLGDQLKAKLDGETAEDGLEDLDLGGEEAPPVGEPADVEDEMPMEEALAGINYVPSQAEIVNEVARRVARRLAKAQKAEKLMKEALGRK